MRSCTCNGFCKAGRRTHLNTRDKDGEQKPVSPCTSKGIDGVSEGGDEELEEVYDDFDECVETNKDMKPRS